MGSASEYQKRAEQCAQRAQIVIRADDRKRWLELAEEWSALHRVPFQRLALQRNEPAGCGAAQPKAPKLLPFPSPARGSR